MPKRSAGILVYRQKSDKTEVLLVHPGGPYWANKDEGAWSIPKGEFDDEEPLQAAKREFKEELGIDPPEGELIQLGEVKYKNGKKVMVWAVAGDLDSSNTKSDTLTIEWPPRSGKQLEIPENDRAEWFDLGTAKSKLIPAQAEFIDRLEKLLGLEQSGQSTLL